MPPKTEDQVFTVGYYMNSERGYLNFENDGHQTLRTESGLAIVSTPLGKVVMYQARDVHRSYSDVTECVIVPGFYLGELPPNGHDQRRMSVRPVKEDQRETVERVARSHGYRGHVNFW